jgi:hypothetical protein
MQSYWLNQMPRRDAPSVTPWRSTTRIPAFASSRVRSSRTTSKSTNSIPQRTYTLRPNR